MKNLFMVLSLILTPLAMAEELEALGDDAGRTHVAQIVGMKEIGVTDVPTLTLVTSWEGGIVNPHKVYLNVWDPEPQDGSDFGTFKTFVLGYVAEEVQIQSRSLINGVLSLDFKLPVGKVDGEGLTYKKKTFQVHIVNGVVASKATLK